MIKVKKTYKSKQVFDEGIDFESSKAHLSWPELVKVRFNKETDKYEMRIKTFISMIKQGKPFDLLNGRKVIIDTTKVDKQGKTILQKLNNFAAYAQTIYDKNRHVPRDKKQAEELFGDKVSIIVPVTYIDGNKEQAEINIRTIKKPIEMGAEGAESREAKQRAAMEAFQRLIDQAIQESGSDSIDIKIGENIVKEVIGIEEQKLVGGVKPKADFFLLRKNDTPYFLSHKDDRSLQWGGVSAFADYSDVKNFLKQLKKFYTDQNGQVVLPEKFTVGCEILNETLKMKVVFGKDFGSGKSGANNIDAVMRGHAILTLADKRGLYILSAPLIMTREGFEGFDKSTMPILTARRVGDRSDFGIKFTRIVADPIGARVVRQWLPSLIDLKKEKEYDNETINGNLG
jgi:hypothetical protein